MTHPTPVQQIESALENVKPTAEITRRVFARALAFANEDGTLDTQQTLLAALEGVASIENTLLEMSAAAARA